MCPDWHTSEVDALAVEAVLPANLVVVRNWGDWGADWGAEIVVVAVVANALVGR
jgi:hypothetical protein